jgi:hypothetical protein
MLPEVALSSILLIVVVLFPGLIFRRFYYWSKFTKQFVKGEWSERIVTSIFWGIFSQMITLLLISYILPILQIKLLEKDIVENDIIEKIRTFSFATIDIEKDRILLFFILGYILFSILVAGLLGLILYKFVRWFEIDIRIEAFRYSNQWHYIFQGEVPKSKKKVLFPWVDVTLTTQQEDGKQKMIQGVLKDYQINATTGDLEYLYLEQAQRYSHTQKDFKRILSDVFVVPFGNVVDMNIRYKYKEKKDYTNIYRGIIITAILASYFFYFSYPWLRATQGTPIWKILLSYLPLSLPLVGVLSTFATIFSLLEKKEQEKRNSLWGTLIMILFSALGWWLASLLLL